MRWYSQYACIKIWVRTTTIERSGIEKFRVARNDGKRESMLLNGVGNQEWLGEAIIECGSPICKSIGAGLKPRNLAFLRIKFTSYYKLISRCCFRPCTGKKLSEM